MKNVMENLYGSTCMYMRKGWEDGRINVNQKIEKLNNMLKFTTPSLVNRIVNFKYSSVLLVIACL